MSGKKAEMPEKRLSEAEMVEILEDIARKGQNAAARIAAIKQLREMHPEKAPASGFEALDGEDELAGRRNAA